MQDEPDRIAIKERKGKEKKEKDTGIIDDIMDLFENDPNKILAVLWTDYQEMRKKKRKPMTDRARDIILKKLKAVTPDIAVKMLENSIVNCWTDVYPLKEEKTAPAVIDIGDDS